MRRPERVSWDARSAAAATPREKRGHVCLVAFDLADVTRKASGWHLGRSRPARSTFPACALASTSPPRPPAYTTPADSAPLSSARGTAP
ncbi:hypothetical protein ACP70R_018820 [Stipagrostis hirtigluma subsp. patula]